MKGEWPAAEVQFLVDNYRTVTNVDLAKYLKRSQASIKHAMVRLRLDQPRMVYAHRVPRPNSEEEERAALERANAAHLEDLERGGYEVGYGELRIRPDTVPFRYHPTSGRSIMGSPAGMCADLAR